MEQVIKIRKQLIGLYKADNFGSKSNLFLSYKWLERFLELGKFNIPQEIIDIEAWKKKLGWDEMRIGQQQELINSKVQPLIKELVTIIFIERQKEIVKSTNEGLSFDEQELCYCLMKSRELLIEYSFSL